MVGLSFRTLAPVLESWEKVKRVPDWNEKFGRALLARVFEKAPLSVTLLFPMFGTEDFELPPPPTPQEEEEEEEKLMHRNRRSAAFQETALECASLVDFCVTSMGADLEFVTAQLNEIMEQHPSFQKWILRPEHWIILGKALLLALQDVLGTSASLDETTTKCWTRALCAISTEMMMTHNNGDNE